MTAKKAQSSNIYKLQGEKLGEFNGFEIDISEFEERPPFLGRDNRGFAGIVLFLRHIQNAIGDFSIRLTTGNTEIIRNKKEKSILIINSEELQKYTTNVFTGRTESDRRLAEDFVFRHKISDVPPIEAGKIESILSKETNFSDLSKVDQKSILKLFKKSRGDVSDDVWEFVRHIQSDRIQSIIQELERGISEEETKSQKKSYWKDLILELVHLSSGKALEGILSKLNMIPTEYRKSFSFAGPTTLRVYSVLSPDTPLLSWDQKKKSCNWSSDLSKEIDSLSKLLYTLEHSKTDRTKIEKFLKIPENFLNFEAILVAGSSKEVSASPNKKEFQTLRGILRGTKVLTFEEFIAIQRK
ncbi:DUF4263 domain-containing protein [Leptospira fluminis]|uniref:DUF4263 domain-containing protein n=1 Tax=Leptospira fluminis TaxID=2484979 RepID=A0A4R9GPQ4_9LEPT|nr:Shedu anti-phage system protein SduA domain-containing protein [Leptospira fluminis]TGK19002.1 DUF4263 domain-containing protein [Leptospira fluminis]